MRRYLCEIKPGKILHIDGTKMYLKYCMNYYQALELDVVGVAVPEPKQPGVVLELLQTSKPDILVLTGHDELLPEYGETRYLNSRYFVAAVQNARIFQSDPKKLVIFAGACQSDYQALIAAGANFASAPGKLLHCLDPAFVAESVACALEDEFISPRDAAAGTIAGAKAILGSGAMGKGQVIFK